MNRVLNSKYTLFFYYFLLSSFFFSSFSLASTETILLNYDEALKHVSRYPRYLANREMETARYRRRISRESQLLKEKLEKFKFDAPTMAPSVKKTAEEELKKYSNVVRKLDYKLKTEIDERDQIELEKVKKELNREIKLYGKKMKFKAIFSHDKEKNFYRARGVSPLTMKVLKQNKDIPDYTEKFSDYLDKKFKKDSKEKVK